MKRLTLILGLLLLCSLPALAQGPDSPWFGFGPSLAGPNFSPYYGAAYRRGCGNLFRHERREDARLREHQWREREACSSRRSGWGFGRCRNLRWHEREEWERLRAHQRAERSRFRCF